MTGKVHGYCRRRLAGTPVSGVPVVIELRLRRLVCTSLDCPRQTFREQVPGLAERYARRTPALAARSRRYATVVTGAHPPVHRCAGRPAPGHLRGLAA